MTNKPIITSTQLLLMSVGSAVMFPYTFLPVLNTPPANQDSWIVAMLMIVYILVINAPMLFLTNKFRGMNLNEMTETVLGRFFGKAVSVLFVLLFLFCFTACMSMGVIFVNIFMFPETPAWALLLFTVIPIIYAAYQGAGTIGRLATFIVPFILSTIVFFFLMGIKDMDLNILRPVLADSTFMELNQGAFLTATRYSEITIFLVFSYFLKRKASINKTYLSALSVYAVSLFLIIIPTLLVLGVDLAKHEWNPYFTYTRQVGGFDFIEKLQSFNILAWFTGMLLKLTIYCFMASYVLSGVFKAKSHRKFVIALSVGAFLVCLLPILNKSSIIVFLRSDKVFPWIIFPFVFVVPLIIVIVYLIRRKKINRILEQRKDAS